MIHVRNEASWTRLLGWRPASPRAVGARLRPRRNARNGGRRVHARAAYVGAERFTPDRACAHRRAAPPRLRNHKAARGEDGRLVLTKPRHCLSKPDLSGGSRPSHLASRRRKKAL